MALGHRGREYGCGSHPSNRAGRKERKEMARNVSRRESQRVKRQRDDREAA